MNRRISDILDDYPESTVELECSDLLSAERIKALTMEKIQPQKRTRGFLRKALLAAAIIGVLTVTVLAAEILGAGGWFRDVFNREGTAGDLDAQVAYIDQIGKVYHQSMTDQGTTITPLAGYGDENIFYLRLRITGPDGSVLPDEEYYRVFGSWEQMDTVLENQQLYHTLTALPDENPRDNEKDFLLKVMAMPDGDRKLNDGDPVLFHIYGLYRQLPNQTEASEFEQVLPGAFTLDLANFNQVEMVELKAAGLRYQKEEVGVIVYSDEEREEVPYDYSVTFTSLEISPLSISFACQYEMSEPSWKVGADIQVVMKDGTVAQVDWGRGIPGSDRYPFALTGQNAFFRVPIDLNNVDYVLLGGEHQVPIPAE